jgi:hypothetical protein
MSFDLVEKLGKPPPKPSDKKEPRKPVEADDDGNDDRKLSPSREDRGDGCRSGFSSLRALAATASTSACTMPTGTLRS